MKAYINCNIRYYTQKFPKGSEIDIVEQISNAYFYVVYKSEKIKRERLIEIQDVVLEEPKNDN